MPSLRDVAATVERQLPGTRCVFGTLRATLGEDDGEFLDQLMADRRTSASHIVKVLRIAGHNVGDQSISRHRRGACACHR